MMDDELTRYEFEILSDEGGLALFRGRSRDPQASILVRRLSRNSFTTIEHKLLSREYSLADELDEAWAARPQALGEWGGRPALVLSDPGGLPLSSFRRQSPDLERFLKTAIAITGALRHLHDKSIVHRDLRPGNLLVDDKFRVWLTGFGVATTLPRERVAPILAEGTSASLKYMAPEQTGRTNRSIDARSDLYSLGVTLYELLTGALPFNASGPMEWIHCHIAREPKPPGDQVKGIPGPVAAIVLKLLAKTAEDRYQTAAGVEADLRHCLKLWEADGYIEPFHLGARDASDRLLIPEKLYGREAEIETLVAALDRVTGHGARELVLVSGYSGVGKSSIVNELQKVLVPSRGLLAAGKFDQYKRNIPYATVAQAFQSLIRQILSRSDDEVASWREVLRGAVGSHGQLLINLIPELALIIGEQQPVPDLPPQEARNRFQLLFRRFLTVFAQREHPLVLFLDDLQWLDAATIELLEHLVNQADVRYLLIIGAYRDNEVTASHPLSRSLEVIRGGGTTLHEIVLAPLTRRDVSELVCDAIVAEPDRAEPLAELVFEKTGGNPFFAIQFITRLAEDGLLTFDQSDLVWRWDLDRIRSKGFTDNVLDLMAARLNRLPGATQEALKQLASLGNRTQIKTLNLVRGESGEEIDAPLRDVVRSGLVLRSDDAYTFLHDRVQEAAYALIPESERAATHLRIGRLFASTTAPAELEEKIFEIVNQLDRGMSLIVSLEERIEVAELNLIAGKRAKASSAYMSALAYLQAGRTLLPEDSWDRHYQLHFALELELAECEFLTGQMAEAEDRLLGLEPRVRSLVERAAVTQLRVTICSARDQQQRAIDLTLEFLRLRGINWSARPTQSEVMQEYESMLERLGSRPIETLIDLPYLTDPQWRALLDVLVPAVPASIFMDNNLTALILCKMVNVSLEFGNCDASCFAYAILASIFGPYFGDAAAGFRFGELAFQMIEKPGLGRYRARVSSVVAIRVIPWNRHVRASHALTRRAFNIAQETGDLTFAAYNCACLVTLLLAAGNSLDEVQEEAEAALEFVKKSKFGIAVDLVTGQLRLVRTLRGVTPQFQSFDDRDFDEARFEQHLETDPALGLAACWYWVRKLQARYLAGEHAAALSAAEKATALLWTSTSFFELPEYHFYGALTQAAGYEETSTEGRAERMQSITTHCQQIETWAKDCPENFADRAALVRAEIARIEGRELEAMKLYERAIRIARTNGFVQNEALAHEIAALFYLRRGFEAIAITYVRNAHSCYRRWGAEGKVRQLEQIYPHLREPMLPSGESPIVGGGYEGLDLANVVKTSLAVSGEVGIEKLIETLMVIVLEHAGAERGLLILPRGNELSIEAEAVTSGQAVDVRLRRTTVAASDLPESILRYVVRTREIVLLDDAKAPNQFSDDKLIALRASRSILCLPIKSKAKLIGILYLENNLLSHVFTPPRIEVLKLLASQAAISLENAALEEKEALLREVHHRVKNNLQLISSLLSLQAARVTDPVVAGLFAESRDRVRSMALVHENLYRLGNFALVPMKPHLESVCAQLFRAYAPTTDQISLRLDISEVQLDLDRAVACGLIVNELVSNALKHAFPNGRRGTVWISLEALGANECLLRVRDDGVGMSKSIDPKTADTLGLQLVSDLADQLHGSVAMRSLDGVDIAITFQTDAGRKTTQ
jgi:predicted ATPase/two-component sensor histidine kinase